MAFLGYFLRRLSLVIPTLLGVTIITFTLTYVLPGNPAVVKAGQSAEGSVSAPVHDKGPSASLTTTVVEHPAWYSWKKDAPYVGGSTVAA